AVVPRQFPQQVVIGALDPGRPLLTGAERATGAGQLPHFLGHAMHVDGEADSAVADERDPQFLLPHRLILAGPRTGDNCARWALHRAMACASGAHRQALCGGLVCGTGGAAMSYRPLVFVSAVALSLGGAAIAQQQQPDWDAIQVTATEIRPGVAVLFGNGGNIGVSHGEDGTLIVDDQFAPLV